MDLSPVVHCGWNAGDVPTSWCLFRAESAPVHELLLAWSAAEALEGVEVNIGGVPWRFVPSVSIWVRPSFTL